MKKLLILSGAFASFAGHALAGSTTYQVRPPTDVPEMSATGAVIALAAIAAGGAMAWERRRNRPPKD